MNKRTAINVLMALACCVVSELRCADCPFLEEEGCRPWNDDEVFEAVMMIKKEGADNG